MKHCKLICPDGTGSCGKKEKMRIVIDLPESCPAKCVYVKMAGLAAWLGWPYPKKYRSDLPLTIVQRCRKAVNKCGRQLVKGFARFKRPREV
jgi:hypothetical protein